MARTGFLKRSVFSEPISCRMQPKYHMILTDCHYIQKCTKPNQTLQHYDSV